MKHFKFLNYLFILIFISSANSCKEDVLNDLEKLPQDSGGEQIAHYLGADDSPYGYFSYLPSGYEKNEYNYPLLVFLHGSGERGNSQLNKEELNKVLKHGPPALIAKSEWSSPYPMVVISPQSTERGWQPDMVHEFLNYLTKKYRINPKHIYLTGLSMGGFGTFNYLEKYSDAGMVAAAIPICGGGNVANADKITVPVWAFHGQLDNVVPPNRSIEMINAINNVNPKTKAKLTIYPEADHDSWTITYNNSGMGKASAEYDPFDENIYQWLFRYSN